MGNHLTFYLLVWFGHGWMKHFNKLLYLFVCLFLIYHLLLIQGVFITCLINWSFDVLTDLHEGAWRRRIGTRRIKQKAKLLIYYGYVLIPQHEILCQKVLYLYLLQDESLGTRCPTFAIV